MSFIIIIIYKKKKKKAVDLKATSPEIVLFFSSLTPAPLSGGRAKINSYKSRYGVGGSKKSHNSKNSIASL